MLDVASPIYECNPNSRWMTVGDGRYGSDAAYLLGRGLSAIATSLTGDLLSRAHDLGFIEEFRAENAEKLSMGDKVFDFVLCKESYHHFPRPPVALYEMIRVAKCGVVLIEPVDNPRILNWFRTFVKKVLRGDPSYEFEPSGNFLYRTSMLELRKLLMAMDGDAFAYKGFNDFFVASLSNYKASGFNLGNIVTRLGIAVQDFLARIHLMGYGLACIVVFNATPANSLLDVLRANGFSVERLPKNPYAGAS